MVRTSATRWSSSSCSVASSSAAAAGSLSSRLRAPRSPRRRPASDGPSPSWISRRMTRRSASRALASRWRDSSTSRAARVTATAVATTLARSPRVRCPAAPSDSPPGRVTAIVPTSSPRCRRATTTGEPDGTPQTTSSASGTFRVTDSRRMAVPTSSARPPSSALRGPLEAEVAADPAHDVVGGGRGAVDEPVHPPLEPQPGGLHGHRDRGGAHELAEPRPGNRRGSRARSPRRRWPSG